MATLISARNRSCDQPTLFNRFFHLYQVWLQRRALDRLDDAALRDIGLTRMQAQKEAHRPIWDAPQYWCK